MVICDVPAWSEISKWRLLKTILQYNHDISSRIRIRSISIYLNSRDAFCSYTFTFTLRRVFFFDKKFQVNFTCQSEESGVTYLFFRAVDEMPNVVISVMAAIVATGTFSSPAKTKYKRLKAQNTVYSV